MDPNLKTQKKEFQELTGKSFDSVKRITISIDDASFGGIIPPYGRVSIDNDFDKRDYTLAMNLANVCSFLCDEKSKKEFKLFYYGKNSLRNFFLAMVFFLIVEITVLKLFNGEFNWSHGIAFLIWGFVFYRVFRKPKVITSYNY